MNRLILAGLVAALATPATAQSWVPWHQDRLIFPSGPERERERNRPMMPAYAPAPRPQMPEFLQGGPRPDISPQSTTSVSIVTGYGPGTIVIDTSKRRLYLMTSRNTALVYPISVGRIGFTWTGTERISRIAEWPNWHPPAEMRERQPELPVVMTGGINNPLGAKALYLGNSLYRIHGTNNSQSIGQANSSGCFRMTNAHVVDLANRVGVGTTVVVKSRL